MAALRERHDRIGDTLARAQADVAELDRLAAARAALVDSEKADSVESERLARELAVARQDLALHLQRAEALRAAVADARDTFDTVAARRRDLRARRDAVRAVSSARIEHDARTRAAADARATFDGLRVESAFAHEDDVRTALRDAPARRRLESVIGEHDAALAAVRRRLLDWNSSSSGRPTIRSTSPGGRRGSRRPRRRRVRRRRPCRGLRVWRRACAIWRNASMRAARPSRDCPTRTRSSRAWRTRWPVAPRTPAG